MIGAGIAQRTVFQGPSETTTSVQTEGSAAYTLIDGSVLTSVPGAQTLRVEGDGAVFVSYGRTADLKAWLADVDYTAVTVDGEGTVQTADQAPTVTPTSDAAAGGVRSTTTCGWTSTSRPGRCPPPCSCRTT